MKIYFIGKQLYTNRDALRDRFGRIYNLPRVWNSIDTICSLALINYRSASLVRKFQDGLHISSLGILNPLNYATLKREVREFAPDAIVASGDCFIGNLGMALARTTKSKFIFDVYDDYRTFSGYKLFLGWDAFQYLLRNADLTLYASFRLAKDHPNGRSTVAPNGIDSKLFIKKDKITARRELGLAEDAQYIGYFGSMVKERGINELLEAMRKLRTTHGNTVRLLACGHLGSGVQLDEPWVDYHGLRAHSEMPTYMSACDVLALPYLSSRFLDSASSCKIAEYLACQRPIAATQTPNIIDNFPIQAKELADVMAPMGDVEAFSRCLGRQLNSPVIATPSTRHNWDFIGEESLAWISQTIAE